MKIKNYFKVFILFIIFYNCKCNKTYVFNKSICKRLTDNKYLANEKRYYCSKNKKPNNQYMVFTKDILRKYIYVVNIIVIFLILQSI
jgi:hypothetical protein